MYLWLKAFHIIAVIAWMAGMLYLPRLFVYHCEAEPGSQQSETFKVMERRLLKAIINPAMIATWVLGLWLAWQGGWFAAPWLHAKFALVLVMSGVHGMLSRYVKDFAADRNREIAEILSYYQRGTDGPDDPDRDPGGGEAVLKLTAVGAISAPRLLRNRLSFRMFAHPSERRRMQSSPGPAYSDRPAHQVQAS